MEKWIPEIERTLELLQTHEHQKAPPFFFERMRAKMVEQFGPVSSSISSKKYGIVVDFTALNAN